MLAVVCLSVCPSVFPVPDAKYRTEGCRKLKIGRKSMTRETVTPFRGQKVIVKGNEAD